MCIRDRVPKQVYFKQVNRAIFRAALDSIRRAVRGSPKLFQLWEEEYYGLELRDFHKLSDARLTARAKLSCLTEFKGDFGSVRRCSCGARDTFRHAIWPQDQDPVCDLYTAARAAHPDRLRDEKQLLYFTKKVITIRSAHEPP